MTTYHRSREDETFGRQKEIADGLGLRTPSVFDIGANVGQSIRSYRRLFPDCTIRAFEPNPAVFERLHSELGAQDGVILERMGLADRDGLIPFHATRVSELGSLLKPSDRLIRLSTEHKYDYEVLDVVCRRLDEYCGQNGIRRIDIVKIDVQGAELAVLKGAANLLAESAITLLYLEIIMADSYEQQSGVTRILELMDRYGYVLWEIMPFLYTRPGRVWTANAVFVAGKAASILEGDMSQDAPSNLG